MADFHDSGPGGPATADAPVEPVRLDDPIELWLPGLVLPAIRLLSRRWNCGLSLIARRIPPALLMAVFGLLPTRIALRSLPKQAGQTPESPYDLLLRSFLSIIGERE